MPPGYARPLVEAGETWQQLAGSVTLRYWDRPDGVLLLTDTRPGTEVFQRRFSGVERRSVLVLRHGPHVSSRSSPTCVRLAARQSPDEPSLRRMLDAWLAARIAVRLDDRYLSLGLRVPDDS